jgi:alginate O-acetyltransferase complex protein AlgI
MAIGIGEMLGFHLPENFNAPYLSKSVSEFWRRWHMTLGQWFKTYIYIPLGGNRKGIYRTVINLAVVWALTGIWHGASYNYILWGIYYGVLVVFEKIVSKKTWYQQIPSLFKWFTTFFCVVIGWVMFRSEDLSQMMLYFKTMFGLVNTDNVLFSLGYYFDTPTAISFVLAVICCFTKPKRIASILENSVWGYSIKNMSLFIIFVFSIIYMVSSTYSSFIYFQF